MPAVEFLPLDPRTINVRTFDCGKEAINVYLRRYAAKNMVRGLNLDHLSVVRERLPGQGGLECGVQQNYSREYKTTRLTAIGFL